MNYTVLLRPQPQLAVLTPPYNAFEPIDLGWSPPSIPPRGLALIWYLVDAARQAVEFEWLWQRPPGLSLIVLLPPAGDISDTVPLLNHLAALNPRAVLPRGRIAAPHRVRDLLALPPRHVAASVTDYLSRRRILTSDEIRAETKRIFELAPEVSSISRLARRLYTSRRTLGRHFAAAGLPVPSHWLQFARLLHVAFRIQSDGGAIFRIACQAGYPDGFTMSNQMKRLLDCRPTEIRRRLGWEWLVELWLYAETRRGGLDLDRYGHAVRPYVRALADRNRAGSDDHGAPRDPSQQPFERAEDE